MIRGLIFFTMAIFVGLVSALFAFKNPGWLFGVASASVYLLKTMNEKRKLRKSIKLAEVELNNLRSLPMQDAG